jgi:hypothetical protein
MGTERYVVPAQSVHRRACRNRVHHLLAAFNKAKGRCWLSSWLRTREVGRSSRSLVLEARSFIKTPHGSTSSCQRAPSEVPFLMRRAAASASTPFPDLRKRDIRSPLMCVRKEMGHDFTHVVGVVTGKAFAHYDG